MKTTAERFVRAFCAGLQGLAVFLGFAAILSVGTFAAWAMSFDREFTIDICETASRALRPFLLFILVSADVDVYMWSRVALVVVPVVAVAVFFRGVIRAESGESAWKWFAALIVGSLVAAVMALALTDPILVAALGIDSIGAAR